MAVKEEVVIDLKVNPKGFDNTISTMEKLNNAVDSFNNAVLQVERTITAIPNAVSRTADSFKRAGSALKDMYIALNITTIAASRLGGGFGILGSITGAIVAPVNRLRNALILRLLPGIGLITTAIAGAVAITKAWNEINENSVKIAEDNIEKTGIWSRAWQDFKDFLTPVAELWSEITLETTKATGALLDWTNQYGGKYFTTLLMVGEWERNNRQELIDLREQEISQMPKLQGELARINIALQDETLDLKEKIALMEDRTNKEKEILKFKDDLLRLEEQDLQYTIRRGGLTREELLPLENRLNGIIRQRNVLKEDGLTLDQRSAMQMNSLLNGNQPPTFNTLPPPEMVRQEAFRFMDDFEEGVKEYLEDKDPEAIREDIWDEFFGDDDWRRARIKIMLDDVEDMEEEHAEKLDAIWSKSARTRLAWQKMQLDGQLNYIGEYFSALSDFSQDNFELQKAFRVGETIMNSASALVAVWRDSPAAAPFLTPLIVAQTIASLAQIRGAQPGEGSVVNPTFTRPSGGGFRPGPTETASPDFYRNNQSRPQSQSVLVLEDLDRTQNRVRVTEDRSTI